MALVVFPSDGGEVVVEVEETTHAGLERVSRGADGLFRAGKTFEQALAGIKNVAGAVVRTLDDLAPDEAEVEVGFKLSAQSGVIVATATGESHIVVKLTWKKKNAPES